MRQRRDGIANDAYRTMCAAVEQMRKQFPQQQLNFHLDFPDDYAERKATAAKD